MRALILLLLSSTAFAAPLPAGRWTIDPQRSKVTFSVIKLQTKLVDGRFRDFSGEVVYNPSDPHGSSLRWNVRVASVETGEHDRDGSIQSAEYLDAARFPELTFVARRINALPDGRIRIDGTISIRGQHRPLTVDARAVSTDPARPIFETRFTLDRVEFGVDGTSMLRHAISRDVRVHLLLVGARQ